MSFLQEYKRLDNLCKDLLNSENGISSYIKSMEQCGYLSAKISGWETDYNALKKYRRIRNKIVHENDIDESDLCNELDEKWLINFYKRIIKCEDPLALYEKLGINQTKKLKGKNNTPNKNEKNTTFIEDENPEIKKYIIVFVLLIIIILGALAGIVQWFLSF